MPLQPSSSSSRRDAELTDREPRLFPATGRGLGIEATRHQQIHVDADGALRLGDGAGATVLAAPGTVRRVDVVGTDPIRPRLVFVGDDGPLVVLALEKYVTSPSAFVDGAADLQTSGAAAVATALGVPIGPAGEAIAATVRGVPVVRPSLPVVPHAVLRLTVAIVLLTVPAVMILAVQPALLLPLVVLAAALVVGPTRAVADLRERALTAMTTSPVGLPGTDGVRTLAPTHPDARSQRTAAALLVGPRRIIEIHHGGETWFPGPAAGGAVLARVSPESIFLEDSAGRAIGRLEGGWATDAEDFQHACTEVGVRVEIDRTPMATVPGLGSLEPWRSGEGPGRAWALDTAEEGGISIAASSLLFAALPFLLGVGLLCGLWQPWAAVFGLPGAVLLALHLRGSARLRRWRRGGRPMAEVHP